MYNPQQPMFLVFRGYGSRSGVSLRAGEYLLAPENTRVPHFPGPSLLWLDEGDTVGPTNYCKTLCEEAIVLTLNKLGFCYGISEVELFSLCT